MKHAFSLIEVLVCIAILVIVAAITYPILTSAKLSGLRTQTDSNLRQLYMAIELYRNENDGKDVGDYFNLGLPPLEYYHSTISKSLKPPLADRYPGLGWYYMMPPDPTIVQPSIAQDWLRYNTTCESRSILLVDVNFSDNAPLGPSPFLERVGHGVRLNGSLSRIRKPGNPLSPGWWTCTQ